MTKCAVITGASRGIGQQAAYYFARQGFNVVLVATNQVLLEQVANTIENKYGVSASFYALDVSERDAVNDCIQGVISKHQTIDVLFNNAGVYQSGTSDTGPDAFDRLLDVNLRGIYNFVHAVTPIMKQHQKGYIFNLASYAGQRPLPHSGSYCLTKYGVVGYSKSLSIELASDNIKVTAICPSVIDTEMTHNFANFPHHEKIQVSDVINTIDYCMRMSPNAIVDEVIIKASYLEKKIAAK